MRRIDGLIATLVVVMVMGVAGCAATRVDWAHPLVSSDPQSARVYFIRPFTERYMDIADNVLGVEADRTELLSLAKGEYALIRLRPGTVFLQTRSKTAWGPTETHFNVNTRAHEIKEMTHSEPFTFEPGGVYFIVLTPIDGEFRGVNYQMVQVDLARAKRLAAHLRVVGATGAERIDRL
jgi:hypothetical protein